MKVRTVFTAMGQSLLAVGCAILGGAGSVDAAFPSTVPTDDSPIGSMGVFRITVLPKFAPVMDHAAGTGLKYPGYFFSAPLGPRIYSPVLFDNNTTVIGRSTVHNHGSIAAAGEPVGSAPSTVVQYSDYSFVPPDFVIPTAPPTREVFTELRHMDLMTSSLGNCCTNPAGAMECFQDPRLPFVPANISMVKAGRDYFPFFGGTAPSPALPRSLGQVQSKAQNDPPGANDYPARSFFNVFAEVTLPALPGSPAGTFGELARMLRNPAPMVVTNQDLTSLPPTVIYIHGATTAAPLVFQTSGSASTGGGPVVTWTAGETFGYLVLAGHGTQLDCSDPAAVQAFVYEVLGPPGNEKRGLPLPSPIPTISQWGLIVLGLLMLTVGTVFILRRRVAVPATAGAV